MGPKLSACMSARPNHVATVCAENQTTKEQFTQDNPHIKTDVIPAGVPFVLQPKWQQCDKDWRYEEPAFARVFQAMLALPGEVWRNLVALNDALGKEQLLALAKFYQAELAEFTGKSKALLKEHSHGLMGAAATASESRT